MKIYALVYKHDIKKDGQISNITTLRLTVAECLEDAMMETEKNLEAGPYHVESSTRLYLKAIMSLDFFLDKIKVSLPELVKNAKERERITKVAELLNKEDDQS